MPWACLLYSLVALAGLALGCLEAAPHLCDDDQCQDTAEGQCALSALQRRAVQRTSASARAASDQADIVQFSPAHAINAWNSHLDSSLFRGEGLYYEFDTVGSELVWSGSVEGRRGSFSNAQTPFPMASASKLFTAFAAMYTMQLKPKDFYPGKFIHTFKGWEEFRDFPVHGTSRKANLTIHHLLTHTSGLPFAMRDSKADIAKQTLFFEPGTQFGYTLGHRLVGWIIRDFWQLQPEAKEAHIQTCDDAFKWLYFWKLGMNNTMFDDTMTQLFGYSGQAGDASIQSTGEDFMKLAVVALRKGRLPSGEQLISERNWNQWAVPNLLPGGKLSKDLVTWEGPPANWMNWNIGNLKESIMKQSGDYGWNYFGATYYGSKEIGWCGFFSSCLRVTYEQDLAFVMMQRDIADLKKSKPYLVDHFNEMAKSLQCSKKLCGDAGRPLRFCEKSGTDLTWSASCPAFSSRGKAWFNDTKLDVKFHTCYEPRCHHR
mmetsp:Transcript_143290/g.399452  ORF Transcript_143290/g.399452 Transcript_143290/m.399452 type:complete len:487 (-) Transcript_143290:171-1631(-)